MASGRRDKEEGDSKAKAGGASKPRGAEQRRSYSRTRREKYRNDPEFRQKEQSRLRQQYRDKNPRKQGQLSKGLLCDGTQREVVIPGTGDIEVRETFSIAEAAKALGKSAMTIRRWVGDNELIPEPVLEDTVYHHKVYDRGELQLIAEALAAHEAEFSNLHQSHTDTIHRIAQSVDAYRRSNNAGG